MDATCAIQNSIHVFSLVHINMCPGFWVHINFTLHRFYLIVFMIDLYHRKILASRQFVYPLFQPVHDLVVCIGSFSRNLHIKDQICSGRTFYHSEIMHTEGFIQKMYHLFYFCLHRKNFLIICHDRIHMDRCGTMQFFL